MGHRIPWFITKLGNIYCWVSYPRKSGKIFCWSPLQGQRSIGFLLKKLYVTISQLETNGNPGISLRFPHLEIQECWQYFFKLNVDGPADRSKYNDSPDCPADQKCEWGRCSTAESWPGYSYYCSCDSGVGGMWCEISESRIFVCEQEYAPYSILYDKTCSVFFCLG